MVWEIDFTTQGETKYFIDSKEVTLKELEQNMINDGAEITLEYKDVYTHDENGRHKERKLCSVVRYGNNKYVLNADDKIDSISELKESLDLYRKEINIKKQELDNKYTDDKIERLIFESLIHGSIKIDETPECSHISAANPPKWEEIDKMQNEVNKMVKDYSKDIEQYIKTMINKYKDNLDLQVCEYENFINTKFPISK